MSLGSSSLQEASISTLLVGFDAAWTAKNFGAITAVLRRGDGSWQHLGPPQCVSYSDADKIISQWQVLHGAPPTLILLDQPTIVRNARGQRPVEHLVCSIISRYKGGMQPAYTGKSSMFGADAPVWRFLSRYGGAAHPFQASTRSAVYETYPALAIVALDWLVRNGITSRLPKYNPRSPNFSVSDWQHVCFLAGERFRQHGVAELALWIDSIGGLSNPRKADQDCVDACLCLLVAIHLMEQEGLIVGDHNTGYIVVPCSSPLRRELDMRCVATGRDPRQWVRSVRLAMPRDQ